MICPKPLSEQRFQSSKAIPDTLLQAKNQRNQTAEIAGFQHRKELTTSTFSFSYMVTK